MNKLAKQRELADEAIKLIEELKMSLLILGEDHLLNISRNENGDTIIFEVKNRDVIEYSLSEIGYIFEDALNGLEIFNKKIDKSQLRCNEICERIKKIQKETEVL